MTDPLLAPMKGVDTKHVGGVQVDVARAGTGRIKRVIYQPGFRWSTHMKEKVATPLCMHAHVGFIARGRIHVEYRDGTVLEFVAPMDGQTVVDATVGTGGHARSRIC